MIWLVKVIYIKCFLVMNAAHDKNGNIHSNQSSSSEIIENDFPKKKCNNPYYEFHL